MISIHSRQGRRDAAVLALQGADHCISVALTADQRQVAAGRLEGLLARHLTETRPYDQEGLLRFVKAIDAYFKTNSDPRKLLGGAVAASIVRENKVYVATLGDIRVLLVKDSAIQEETYLHVIGEERDPEYVPKGVSVRDLASTPSRWLGSERDVDLYAWAATPPYDMLMMCGEAHLGRPSLISMNDPGRNGVVVQIRWEVEI